jgi:hypothetical protein
MEEACDSCGGFDAHPARVVIAWTLSGSLGLDITLRKPGTVEEDDDLVVLHADEGLVYYYCVERKSEPTEASSNEVALVRYHRPSQSLGWREDSLSKRTDLRSLGSIIFASHAEKYQNIHT